MSLPGLVKTWRMATNRLQATTGTQLGDFRTAMLHLKNGLIGSGVVWKDTGGMVASAPNVWEVVGSSNGTTAGMDAVDRWASITDLKWDFDGQPHSWIVLKQTGIGSNFRLLIDLANTYGTAGYRFLGQSTYKGGLIVCMSPQVLTGGTISTAPTFSNGDDYFRVMNSEASYFMWLGDPPGTFQTYSHLWMSTDGTCTRYCVYMNGLPMLFFLIDVPRNPIVVPGPPQHIWNGADEPFIAGGYGAQTSTSAENAMLMAKWLDSTNRVGTMIASQLNPTGRVRNWLSLTAEAGMLSSRDYVARALDLASEFDTSYPMLPMGLACYNSGYRGRCGVVFDLWSGCPSLLEGDTYPSDGTKQFVQMGDLILPWDRSVPQIL